MNGGFRADVKINKKDFMSCNLYYIRKYLGVKELVLVTLLGIAGGLLFYFYNNILMLILFGVTVLLLGACILFFYATANAGFKFEYGRRNAERQIITFNDLGFVIETHEDGGKRKYTDKFLYADIDRIAVLADVIYIFATVALNYYITRDALEGDGFDLLKEFLVRTVDAQKFKMKQKKKRGGLYVGHQNNSGKNQGP